MVPEHRPNILWIYCDELRSDVLGCYGNGLHGLTPNIDGLAARGTLFENFFTNSPVCVPARVSMHTGQLPEATGVFHNEADVPGYEYRGPPSFMVALQQDGYRCINVGKEHVPDAMKPWSLHIPQGARMREMLGGLSVEELRGIVTPGSRQIVAGLYPEGYGCPGVEVTAETCRLLRSLREPFVLRASFLQPHTPVIAESDDMAKAERSTWWEGLEERDGLGRAVSAFEERFGEVSGGMELTAEEVRRARQTYAAVVAWVDRQVGELLAALDESGARDSTAVVVTADHGANLGEGGAFGKHTFAPQCQRVPFVVSWPGEVASGARRAELAQGIDVPKTMCDLTGVSPPEWVGGRSLMSGSAPERVFGAIGYGEKESKAFPTLGVGQYGDAQGWPRRGCVRTQRFRLDGNVRLDGRDTTPAERDVFLADVLADPYEVKNLADDGAYATIRSSLEHALLEQSRVGADVASEDVYTAVERAHASLSKTRGEIMW